MAHPSSRWQVLLLATAQALYQTAVVLVMTIGSLAGAAATSDPRLATAPIGTMFLGTALATMPASLLMARVGRRIGFMVGTFLGICGGVLCAAGTWGSSLALLSLGTFAVGVYQAFAQFYRFAAAEASDAEFRPRAISLVLAGGVVAAIVGPELARYGGGLIGPQFTGSFLIVAVVSLVAMGLLLGLRTQNAAAAAQASVPARPISEVLTQPAYLIALFGAATGYGVMMVAMTATPLSMAHYHHRLTDVTFVIQAHALGMFAPSFVTGSLIERYGVLPIMLLGVVLLAAHVAGTLTGTEVYTFLGSLILLGVGWNFLYIGGTTLLTRTYTASERAYAQAVNDLSIILVGALSSLSAGFLLEKLGWQYLNLVLLPWLIVAAALLLWLGHAHRGLVRSSTG